MWSPGAVSTLLSPARRDAILRGQPRHLPQVRRSPGSSLSHIDYISVCVMYRQTSAAGWARAMWGKETASKSDLSFRKLWTLGPLSPRVSRTNLTSPRVVLSICFLFLNRHSAYIDSLCGAQTDAGSYLDVTTSPFKLTKISFLSQMIIIRFTFSIFYF